MTARSAVADAMDFWSFAAGAANVVMQLSWPEVGHGVAESTVTSGSLMHHPWKRARTTFSYLAVAILGSPQDRAAYRAAVDGAHRQVRSTPTSPVKYNAFDRDLQMWVAACLFVGLEDTYQLLRGELTPETRRDLLPLRVHPGHHAAGHRGPVARHPGRVRRLLELRVRARRRWTMWCAAT